MECIAELETGTLAGLLALVREHTGIAMTERKSALLEGRLRPRLRDLGLDGYEPYLALLRRGGAEVQQFINMVTTNDTLFFRTPAVWDWFASVFLPAWRHALEQAGEQRVLRIWSAAAASGEEAYSIVMLCEQFRRAYPALRYQVLATDISTQALEEAARGVYAGRSAERLRATHPGMVAAWFRDDGDSLAASAELKSHVQFGLHNLFAAPSGLAPFDLIFLRNVLIYFDEENQRRVLGHVRRLMTPAARLVIGEQESITRINTPFVFEQAHIYQRGSDV